MTWLPDGMYGEPAMGERRQIPDVREAARIVEGVVAAWDRMRGIRLRLQEAREEFVRAVEEAAAQGVRKADIARALGIPRNTLQEYLRREREREA